MDYSQMTQSMLALAGGLIVCICFAVTKKAAKERNINRIKQKLNHDRFLLSEQYNLYLDKAMAFKSQINSILDSRYEQHNDPLSKCLHNGDLVLDIRKRYVSDKKKFRDMLWLLQVSIALSNKYGKAITENILKVSIDDDLIEYIFDYYHHHDLKLTYTKFTIEEMLPVTGAGRIAQQVWLIQIFVNESLEIKKRIDEISAHITKVRHEYSVGIFDYEKAMKEIEPLTYLKGCVC